MDIKGKFTKSNKSPENGVIKLDIKLPEGYML